MIWSCKETRTISKVWYILSFFFNVIQSSGWYETNVSRITIKNSMIRKDNTPSLEVIKTTKRGKSKCSWKQTDNGPVWSLKISKYDAVWFLRKIIGSTKKPERGLIQFSNFSKTWKIHANALRILFGPLRLKDWTYTKSALRLMLKKSKSTKVLQSVKAFLGENLIVGARKTFALQRAFSDLNWKKTKQHDSKLP